MPEKRVLLNNAYEHDLTDIDRYIAQGGYEALKKALKMQPAEVVDEVVRSELRGRGGAGFPTGRKWTFLPKESKLPIYLVCNADESEPGTFKDRLLINRNPHLLIEGMILSAYAIKSPVSYLFIRGEMVREAEVLERCLEDARKRGYIGENILGSGFSHALWLHRGAGAYICGEETGLLSSLEGGRGYPKLKPPFPAVKGLFGAPTIVNNVETLCNVPLILANGADWFKGLGIGNNAGTRLYSVSGCVNKPGVYELPLGTVLREIIEEHGGGVWKGKKLKAIIPGGSSVPLFTEADLDCPMGFDEVAKRGSLLGSAGVIVLDEDVCIVDALLNLAKFYAHESCGQCTPCREGTHWVEKIVHRIHRGGGRPEDIGLLLDICDNMAGKTICPLADALVMPVRSYLDKFRDEFEAHIREKGCPYRKEAVAVA